MYLRRACCGIASTGSPILGRCTATTCREMCVSRCRFPRCSSNDCSRLSQDGLTRRPGCHSLHARDAPEQQCHRACAQPQLSAILFPVDADLASAPQLAGHAYRSAAGAIREHRCCRRLGEARPAVWPITKQLPQHMLAQHGPRHVLAGCARLQPSPGWPSRRAGPAAPAQPQPCTCATHSGTAP